MQVIHQSFPLAILSFAVALPLNWGCGNESESPDAGLETVELGTGTVSFEPLIENQELTLIAGLQGGYHFVVHARMKEMLPGDPSRPGQLGNPITQFLIFKEDGTRIDIRTPPYRLGYREATGGFYDLPSGRILQLDQDLVIDQALVPEIYGTKVRLRVEVRDAQGKRATDERWIIAVEQENGSPTVDAGPQ